MASRKYIKINNVEVNFLLGSVKASFSASSPTRASFILRVNGTGFTLPVVGQKVEIYTRDDVKRWGGLISDVNVEGLVEVGPWLHIPISCTGYDNRLYINTTYNIATKKCAHYSSFEDYVRIHNDEVTTDRSNTYFDYSESGYQFRRGSNLPVPLATSNIASIEDAYNLTIEDNLGTHEKEYCGVWYTGNVVVAADGLTIYADAGAPDFTMLMMYKEVILGALTGVVQSVQLPGSLKVAVALPPGSYTMECELFGGSVNINGTKVTRNVPCRFSPDLAGKTIDIGGTPYVVDSVTSPNKLILTTPGPFSDLLLMSKIMYSGDIIKSLLDDYCAGEGFTYDGGSIQQGAALVGSLDFSGPSTIHDAIQVVLGLNPGYYQSVDESQKFWFGPRTAVAAPKDFTDHTNADKRNINVTRTLEDVRNTELSVINWELVPILEKTFSGAGAGTLISGFTDFPIGQIVSCQLNGEDVNIGTPDAAGCDFYYVPNDKLFWQNPSGKIYTVADVVVLKYRRSYTNIIKSEDGVAVASRLAAEGSGSGRYIQIIDRTACGSVEEVNTQASTSIATYKDDLLKTTLDTFDPGYNIGQCVTVDIDDRKVNSLLFIDEISMSDAGLDEAKDFLYSLSVISAARRLTSDSILRSLFSGTSAPASGGGAATGYARMPSTPQYADISGASIVSVKSYRDKDGAPFWDMTFKYKFTPSKDTTWVNFTVQWYSVSGNASTNTETLIGSNQTPGEHLITVRGWGIMEDTKFKIRFYGDGEHGPGFVAGVPASTWVLMPCWPGDGTHDVGDGSATYPGDKFSADVVPDVPSGYLKPPISGPLMRNPDGSIDLSTGPGLDILDGDLVAAVDGLSIYTAVDGSLTVAFDGQTIDLGPSGIYVKEIATDLLVAGTSLISAALIEDLYVDDIHGWDGATINIQAIGLSLDGSLGVTGDIAALGTVMATGWAEGMVVYSLAEIVESLNGKQDIITGAPGEWPTFADVALSGDYTDLINKPSLATVATSGAYADLTGKPTLGTAASHNEADFAAAWSDGFNYMGVSLLSAVSLNVTKDENGFVTDVSLNVDSSFDLNFLNGVAFGIV